MIKNVNTPIAKRFKPSHQTRHVTTTGQLIQQLQEYMNSIPDWKIHYSLKQWGLTYIRHSITHVAKAAVTLHDHRLPVTVNLAAALTNKTQPTQLSQLRTQLHALGDRAVILSTTTTTPGKGGALVWVTNQKYRDTVHHPNTATTDTEPNPDNSEEQ